MGTIQAGFVFSSRILEHLGIAAYNSVRKCLAELVANSYDADATEASVTLPDTIDENAIIVVEDNGLGMSPADLCSKFLYIGRNRREEGQRSESGRLIIGSHYCPVKLWSLAVTNGFLLFFDIIFRFRFEFRPVVPFPVLWEGIHEFRKKRFQAIASVSPPA